MPLLDFSRHTVSYCTVLTFGLGWQVESNGYIHPSAQEFLRDLAHQASFYRSIPSTNLYTFFTSSILSVGLQTALSDAILTHSLSLRPPPPLLVTVSELLLTRKLVMCSISCTPCTVSCKILFNHHHHDNG